MRRVVTWTIATTAALGMLVATPAASPAEPQEAAAVVAPRILSPADGAVLDAPVTSVRVDFTGVEPGWWLVRNSNDVLGNCRSLACYGDTWVQVAAGDRVRDVRLESPLDDAGRYSLFVQNDLTSPAPGTVAESAFTLRSAVSYLDVEQDRPRFVPDQGGSADTTVLRFTTEGAATRPVARVFGGPVIRNVASPDVTGSAYDGWTVTWDGRDSDGEVVYPDDYLIVVDTADARGSVARLTREVTVAIPSSTPGTTRVSGARPTATSATGSCVARPGAPAGKSTLRCRGSRGAAWAQYEVRIPEGAEVDGFRVRGTSVATEGSRIVRRLAWVRDGRAAVRVRVTGPASVAVERVVVRWTVSP